MLTLERRHFECGASGIHLAAPNHASSSRVMLDGQFQLSHDALITMLSGSDLLTKESAMTAIGTAMSFPSYFGRNWEALRDCLTDLSWIESNVVVLVIEQAEVLQTESEVVRKLQHCFSRAVEYWRNPWDIGEMYRKVSRFHILLRADSSVLAALETRFGEAACDSIPCPYIGER